MGLDIAAIRIQPESVLQTLLMTEMRRRTCKYGIAAILSNITLELRRFKCLFPHKKQVASTVVVPNLALQLHPARAQARA